MILHLPDFVHPILRIFAPFGSKSTNISIHLEWYPQYNRQGSVLGRVAAPSPAFAQKRTAKAVLFSILQASGSGWFPPLHRMPAMPEHPGSADCGCPGSSAPGCAPSKERVRRSECRCCAAAPSGQVYPGAAAQRYSPYRTPPRNHNTKLI